MFRIPVSPPIRLPDSSSDRAKAHDRPSLAPPQCLRPLLRPRAPDKRSLAYADLDPEQPFVEGDDVSRPRSMGNPLSAWAKVREAAFAPAEAIAAELRTASAPDPCYAGRRQPPPAAGVRVRSPCRSDEQHDYSGRIAMNLTRRDLAFVGVFALSATTLIVPAMAGTDDEEAVKQAVEALRKAILA